MEEVQRLTPDFLGSRFLKDLDILHTANGLRQSDAAPGMVSYLERALLQNLVRTTWRGESSIVDLGSFLGASIVAAAGGLRASGLADRLTPGRFPDGKPIHGYELGHFPDLPDQANRVRRWDGVDYHPGDSFVARLEEAVAPCSELVRLHIGDLAEESWPPGAAIEVLFLDVGRTSKLNAHVTREFYPALVPGGSTLIIRDLFSDLFPWLKVTMGALKDHFRWEGQVQSSAVYRTLEPVPADVAAVDPFDDASYEECLALHDAVEFPGLHRRFQLRMGLSRAHLMRLKGHRDDALDTLAQIESEYADLLVGEENASGTAERQRFDRAVHQATTSTQQVRARPVSRKPTRTTPDVSGGRFVMDLGITETADRLRRTDVAPGMLSYLERAMLTNLVTRTWRGDGAIIDGGSFFGSSIVASAEGVRAIDREDVVVPERYPDGKPIHGYELGYFPVGEAGSPQVRSWFGIEYHHGDSFLPILEKAVEPYADLVRLHIGDLNEETWPDGAPIEIAFIDVCKTIDLNAHVSEQFYPALIPGGSTLINQDFFFDRCPWIKVTMGYLEDYFSWEGQVQSSSVYRTVKEIPKDVAAYDPFREATYEECLALHDAIEFPGIHRRFEYRMQLSRAYLMALKGHQDDALDTLEQIRSDYADLLGDHHVERGEQFRYDRALRQISTGNIFKVVGTIGRTDARPADAEPDAAPETDELVDRAVAAASRLDPARVRELSDQLLADPPGHRRPAVPRSGLKPPESDDGWAEGDWLHGWAWDREHPDRILHVVVVRDGEPLLVVPADVVDPSLDDVPGRGAHAYRIPVLAELLDGDVLRLEIREAGPVHRGRLVVDRSGPPRLLPDPA